jgi:hypothetical protein
MFLSKEQVLELTYKEAKQQMKLLEKTYKLDKSLKDYLTPELWDNLDDLINTILYLEDHIYNYEDPRKSLMKIEE